MSPESELRAPTSGGPAATSDTRQRPTDAPARRPAPSETASGRLPDERGTGLATLWVACSFVAVASAAVFVACGLWQANAIISRAQEVAQVAGAHATAPARPSSRARLAPTVPSGRVAPDPVLPTAAAVTGVARVSPEKAASSTDSVLTAAAHVSKAGASASAFEAQAEASERVVPVGLDAGLQGSAGALAIGQPPPPDYPRVGCKDIFVYIVTLAEGAPRRSAASIGVGKKGPARLRHPGETLGDWTVLAITDDWTGINPNVWLEKDGAACRAELAGNPSRIHQTPKPRPKAKARRRRRR
jgi:hypothetical protein